MLMIAGPVYGNKQIGHEVSILILDELIQIRVRAFVRLRERARKGIHTQETLLGELRVSKSVLPFIFPRRLYTLSPSKR